MTERVYSYKIVGSLNIHELSQKVDEAISCGWQPYGSAFISGGSVCQPMVLYVVEQEGGPL